MNKLYTVYFYELDCVNHTEQWVKHYDFLSHVDALKCSQAIQKKVEELWEGQRSPARMPSEIYRFTLEDGTAFCISISSLVDYFKTFAEWEENELSNLF